MIPGSGLRQVVKGEDRMELTQVWWDISWLSVRLERLHKSLGDCGSCSDVLWFRKESSGPNAIAFFKGFIREVKVGRAFRLGVGRQLGCCVGLVVFIVSTLNEHREWACMAGIHLLRILLLCLVLISAFTSAGNTAAWQAPCHSDGSRTEVNLLVVLVEPGHSKDHALLSKPSDCKQNVFGVAIICHDHINYFMDASSFIQSPIYIVDRDQLEQLLRWKFGLVDKILINKVSSHTSVNHGFSGSFFQYFAVPPLVL